MLQPCPPWPGQISLASLRGSWMLKRFVSVGYVLNLDVSGWLALVLLNLNQRLQQAMSEHQPLS